MVRPSLNQTAQERVKGMVELRDQVHRLIDAQLDEHSDEEIAVMQQEHTSIRFGFQTSAKMPHTIRPGVAITAYAASREPI